MISGKPVKSSIAQTSSPASRSSCAVPPVEISSMPSSARPRAKSTIPRLSETDSRARRTRTAPGSTTGGSVAEGSAMPASINSRAAGKSRPMEHDPEQALERDAAELGERIDRLESSIEESHDGLESIAGDWDQTDDQAGGEDPGGAHEEPDEPSEDRRPDRPGAS